MEAAVDVGSDGKFPTIVVVVNIYPVSLYALLLQLSLINYNYNNLLQQQKLIIILIIIIGRIEDKIFHFLALI